MIGSKVFCAIDSRLKQITGKKESFGGISILLCGNFNQLNPGQDRYIFEAPPNNIENKHVDELYSLGRVRIFSINRDNATERRHQIY